MTKNLALAAIQVALLVAARSAGAAPEPVQTSVVLHVKDCDHVPSRQLAEAERLVSDVYATGGVTIVWTDGAATLAAPDGRFHADVFILNLDQTQRKHPEPAAFGQASHITRRAYLYYGRILQHAVRTGGDPAIALAVVLAHEVGHVLMPEAGHADSGLMRATWEGRLATVPALTTAETASISLAVRSLN